MDDYRAQFEEHAGHRLAVMLDAEDMSAGVMCESCGEYVIEWDDYEPPSTEGAAEALAKADGEVTALADALRAAGVAPTTVQAIINHATPRGR